MMEIETRWDLSKLATEPRDRRTKPIQRVLIHRNTVAPDVDGVGRYFSDTLGWRLFPYHRFIDTDQECSKVYAHISCAQVDVITPHAAAWNPVSVGLAINADFRKVEPDPKALADIVDAIALLRDEAWAFNRMLGRPDVMPTIEPHDPSKPCPGDRFPMKRVRAALPADGVVVLKPDLRWAP